MASPSLVDYVLANVDFKSYYQSKFPEWNGDHNSNVSCPFSSDHAQGTDKKASFSVNIHAKGGCYCQSCGKRIGSIIHFEKETSHEKGVDDETAASRIFSNFIRPILAAPRDTESRLMGFHTSLKGAPKIFGSLQNEVQISEKTAERFDLGWEPNLRRVTIPVFDTFNQLLNVRHYRLPSMRENEKFPKILNEKGYGSPAAIFPARQLFSLCSSKHRPPIIYWMTGERDTLKAWDDGVPSFCYTTGENVAKQEWVEEIKALHCTVGVVQDNDKAGKEGAEKRLLLLKGAGVPCFLMDLEGDKIKDYSDYRREGGAVQDFIEYGKSEAKKASNGHATPKPNGVPSELPEQEEEEESEFFPFPKVVDPTKQPSAGEFTVNDIGHKPELLNSPIKVRAIVSGKMSRTFSIPNIFEMGGNHYQLPISREMLQLLQEKDENIKKMIGFWLHTKAAVKIVGHITVTEVEIIPMIQPGMDSPYVNQRCYFFGPHIECNKPYLMTVIPTTNMKTQETLGLITGIVPVSNILDSYKFDDASYQLLSKEFHPAKGMTIVENLRALAHSIAENWSGIRNRDDLHLTALLTWLSPLQFEFPFEGLQRGWLNTLVLGDTETGKSRVCQKLTSLFQCGVFINAESCSYVGLVGGAIKSSSGMFLLRWGKIPLYNRQLVVMEELSGLSTMEISWMSDIRSAGVARYDKAGLTGETSAKTRLICLSNVRGEQKSLSDYNSGVQAAQALVGHNEDLARFDLVLTATDDEVDGNIINKDRSTEEKKSFTEDELKAFKELVMFAWSLKPEQIDFTISAYRACLTETLKLCKVYHPSLPVFKSGSGRLKLARLAVAIACVQFAWDNVAEKLVVTDKHVEAAAELLDRLYRKPSFGYARYSHVQYNLQKVTDEDGVLKVIKDVIKEKDQDFYLYVSYSNGFTKFDVSEAMGVHQMMVERVISKMFLSNLLKKGEGRSEWTLSRAGRRWVDSKLKKGIL